MAENLIGTARFVQLVNMVAEKFDVEVEVDLNGEHPDVYFFTEDEDTIFAMTLELKKYFVRIN